MEELLLKEDQETFIEDDFNINETVELVGTKFQMPSKNT